MRKSKLLPIIGVALLVSPLAACGGKEESSTVLRVLNMEDYIYVQDLKEGYTNIDLIEQFAKYIKDKEIPNSGGQKYGKVEVIYDTTDTNETLYSEMQTGKALYDLICPSDYMIQKLIASNMIVPLDKDLVPNYYGSKENDYEDSKASFMIKNIFDNLPGHIIAEDKDVILRDYAVGYMWGTLGILFNPDYSTFEDRGYSRDKVIADMTTWDVLWDEQYKNTISVKDSMRDTYAIGVIRTFKDEILKAQEEYYDAPEEEKEEALEEYKEKFDEIFNRCDEETVKLVEKELDQLKKNVFGLEVDSGKEDIITDKIGINLAWSGDAVYSMDQGEDGLKVGEATKELCYSVPLDGSNLWFDAWVMPRLNEGERSEKQYYLAHEFLNFLCKTDGFTIVDEEGEEIEYEAPVKQNMDYIGYTSFMGGDSTLELIRDWYDIRTYEICQEVEVKKYVYEYYDVYRKIDDDEFSEEPLDYPDCMSDDHDYSLDEQELYYLVEEEDEDGEIVSNFLPVIIEVEDDDGEIVEKTKTYGDLLIVDDPLVQEENGIQVVDLSHILENTLDEYTDYDEYGNPVDTLFYTDCYYCADEDGELSESVGRQFYCQYPDKETLNRCSVMKDYGKNNEYVMKMWERFKSNSLPTWAIILFIVEIAAIVGLILYFVVNKRIKKRLRISRLNAK